MSVIRTTLSSLYKRQFFNKNLVNISSAYSKSTQAKIINNEESEPVQYSTSPANSWKASYSRTGRTVERLWYEPFVIVGSLAVFMLYCFILREENDIDIDLSKTLYSRIEGLERKQLEITLEYNQRNGLDTRAVSDRLAQLDKEEQQQ